MNGARWLKGADSTATNPIAPNVDQGFGRVHVPWTIPSDEEPNVQLLYADGWSTDKQALAFAGDAFQFTFEATGKVDYASVSSGQTPRRGIQNSLVLSLEHLPSIKKWSGTRIAWRSCEVQILATTCRSSASTHRLPASTSLRSPHGTSC